MTFTQRLLFNKCDYGAEVLTSSSGNVPVLKELCCLVPVYFFDPDIRPPARRAKAHLHGLGFAFAPGVRGAIKR